ncbi:hypothetical protein NCCP2716_22770 [Sporosarcina sp. NCCP-2716]|uniref:hypothetical protein n=1 Tax=Sporosarcina sp. NCCP-2716 TaxID=2943679 RepID=UPI00203BB860|nr:hypothetical protein [Sporosarcina sp. NCCP-2716]GKV69779.1 hypothetical protein NCCP2716_22770 [Sporosarcina sp. NCCP-2716]
MNQETKEQIVDEVVWQIYEAYPWLSEKFGDNGRFRTAEDNFHHLNHLETAFQMDDPRFFLDYTKWLNDILTSRNVGTELIVDNFERLVIILPGKLDDMREKAFLYYLQQALMTLHQLSGRGGVR